MSKFEVFSKMHPATLQNLSPFPSYENLKRSITTRILAERLNRRRENQSASEKEASKSQSLKSQCSSDDRSRSSLKFLLGAALPNSVARSTPQAAETSVVKNDKRTHKAKRDAYVEEVIQRLRMKHRSPEKVDSSEVQSSDDVATSTTGKTQRALSVATSAASKDQTSTIKVAQEDGEKERVRIVRRTSVLSPLPYGKLPTQDSIKNAISNSNTVSKVIDVNNMERKNAHTLDAFSWSKIRASKASKQIASKYLRQKSILKNQDVVTKPARTVSILENTKEDSQTQTVLKMKDLKVISYPARPALVVRN